MPRGGYRPGSGPKKGSKQRQRAEIESRLAELGCDPIEGLVVIAKDEKTSTDTKARVLIELAGYCHAKKRPEPQRQRFPLDTALPVEAQARQVLTAWSAGALPADEASAALQSLSHVAQMTRDGAVADLVVLIAGRMGIPLPGPLQLRAKMPAALNQEATP
jgi:hypothetical protein